MKKSGIQIFGPLMDDFVARFELKLSDPVALKEDGDLAGFLEQKISAIKMRETGAQQKLRDDLGDIFELASSARRHDELWAAIAATSHVAALKPAVKSSDKALQALLKAAFSPKLASAYYCRLKSAWTVGLTSQDVRTDLEERGASPKEIRARFDQKSLANSKLRELAQTGKEVGLYVWAKFETSNLMSCEIVDVLENT